MQSYKVRIDSHDRSNIKLLLDKYCDRYVLSIEGQHTENPHCHIFLVTTAKHTTIRDNIRRKFGKGNRCYSMIELDEEYPLEYLAYIIKEGDYIEHNMPPEILVQAKEHDIQVKLELKERKNRKKKTVLKQIDEMYFSEAKDGIIGDRYITPEYIADRVVDYYLTTEGLIREFMVSSITDTLSLKYVNSYRRSFVRRILDRLK